MNRLTKGNPDGLNKMHIFKIGSEAIFPKNRITHGRTLATGSFICCARYGVVSLDDNMSAPLKVLTNVQHNDDYDAGLVVSLDAAKMPSNLFCLRYFMA